MHNISTPNGRSEHSGDYDDANDDSTQLRSIQQVSKYCLDPDAPRAHVLIEGDNLPALHLLNSTHSSRIDFIYIDPPYNTGNNGFTYSDNFWQYGDRHGSWLEFMKRRLDIARELMADHGLIAISIDDREYAHLKILCDSIFDQSNWVATLIWHSKYTVANDARFFSRQHEYILIYAKNRLKATVGRFPRTEKTNAAYRNPDDDPRGPWKATPIHAKSGTRASSYEITFPNGRTWTAPVGRYPRYSKKRLLELYADGRLWFGKSGSASVSAKTFLAEVADVTPGTVLTHDQVGHTHGANEQLARLIGKGSFDNPKPVELLTTLIKLCATNPNSIILDFFAGSGTTAEAVARLNHSDSGYRQAILCTSNENRICETVTFPRLRAIHTGIHASDANAMPIPLPLQYFRLTDKKNASTRQSFVSLLTGMHQSTPIDPTGSISLVSNGKTSSIVVHQLNANAIETIVGLRQHDDLTIYAPNKIAQKLGLAGIEGVEIIQ